MSKPVALSAGFYNILKSGANASKFFIKIECSFFDEFLIKIGLFDEIEFCICSAIKTRFIKTIKFLKVPFIRQQNGGATNFVIVE